MHRLLLTAGFIFALLGAYALPAIVSSVGVGELQVSELAEVDIEAAAEHDGCDGECPGEQEGEGCPVDCSFCGCCGVSPVADVVSHPERSVAAPRPCRQTPLDDSSPASGVSHGVFKPPRVLSA
jgi:hypothetical protein